jgi:hypothetical protein
VLTDSAQLEPAAALSGILAPNREIGAQQGKPASNSDSDYRAEQPETVRRRLGSWVPFLGLVLDRRVRQTQRFDDQDRRLLQLRDSARHHIEASVHGNVRTGALVTPESDSPEELSGKRESGGQVPTEVLRLEDIAERGYEHTLGSGITAAHVKIWKQGSHYLMQQIDGSPLAVNGTALTSPLVVLEDGDEVTHAAERLKLRMS